MAFDQKYGEVTTEKGKIGAEEPVFVLRAKDQMSVLGINQYRDRVIEKMREEDVPEQEVEAFEASVNLSRDSFVAWQEENAERVVMPD